MGEWAGIPAMAKAGVWRYFKIDKILLILLMEVGLGERSEDLGSNMDPAENSVG